MTARNLLRARFPESEGWRSEARLHKGRANTQWTAAAWKGPVRIDLNGQRTAEVAAQNLIAAWDAATHAEKVRDLVRRVEEVQEIAEDRGDVQDGPEGQPIPNSWMVAGTMLREALAALPEHWKEVPRGK